MRFNLTLFPLDTATSLRDSAAELRAEFDGAGLCYHETGSELIVEAAWDELAPVLGRAEGVLRQANNRVCMVLSVEPPHDAANRLAGAIAAIERTAAGSLTT